MAFVAGEDGRELVFLDGSRFDAYGPDWKVGWPLVFSESGGVVACRLTSLSSSRECIGVDGRRGEEFDRVGPPVLSRDGKRAAYRAQEGVVSFAVVDGRRGPEFRYMTDPAISADGRTVAYGAKDGGWRLFIGGFQIGIPHQPSGLFRPDGGWLMGYWHLESPGNGASRVRVVVRGQPGEAFSMVGIPAVSPDQERVTYAADDGPRQFIVIDDRKVEVTGRESDPVFSPDGRKVGYGARIGREIWWKVLGVGS